MHKPLLIQIVNNGFGRIDRSALRHDIGLGEDLERVNNGKGDDKKGHR